MKPSSEPLSDLWRENRSSDTGCELASILNAARVMARTLVGHDIQVYFAGIGSAHTDLKKITLTSSGLDEHCPQDGNTVDYLLGLTVHEAGHILFSPDKHELRRRIEKDIMRISGYAKAYHAREIVEHIMAVLEDIYIDYVMSAFPNYRDYLNKQIRQSLDEIDEDGVAYMLYEGTQKGVVNAILYYALSGKQVPKDTPVSVLDAMSKFLNIAMLMCQHKLAREKAIVKAYEVISKLPEQKAQEPQSPPTAQRDTKGDAEKPSGDGEEEDTEEGETTTPEDTKGEAAKDDGDDKDEAEDDEDDGESKGEAAEGEANGDETDIPSPEMSQDGEPEGETEEAEDVPYLDDIINEPINKKQPLEKDIARDVADALVNQRQDLTQMVSLLADKSRGSKVLVQMAEADAMALARAQEGSSSVEESLRRVFQEFRLKRTKDLRGLQSGRVSARRLHRAGYGDDRVFQRRERPDKIDMTVALLMDCSGSVSGHADLINQTIVSLVGAMRKENVEFIALGYSSFSSIYILRLYDRETGKVLLGSNDKKWSMTPSYEGIAAAVAQLLRLGNTKNKVLIHFTDGMPDHSDGIPELLEKARGQGIQDIHIGLGQVASAQFTELYGRCIRIDTIQDLPDVIEKVLREVVYA